MNTSERPPASAWSSRIVRFASVLTISIWLAFFVGLAGRWWWFADLFSHFRVQYAILLLLCAASLLSLKRWRIGLLAGMGSLLMGASVLWYSGLGAQQAMAADGQPFRFVTFNKYFRNNDAARIGRYLESTQADVIAMQEVESSQFLVDVRPFMPSYPHMYVTTRMRHGVVVLSRWPLRHAETIELVPGGAQIAKAEIDWRGQPITLMGVHLHWPIGAHDVSLRNAELERLLALAHEVHEPLIIGGDFNLTAWSPNYQAVRQDPVVRDCAEGHGMPVTWPTLFPPMGIRIDQCLHSKDWDVTQVASGPMLGSDHYPTINDLRYVAGALRAAKN
ncbi:MAG: endonuclease/exonuclease/phosphatase family protein [Povalibacter sp.]